MSAPFHEEMQCYVLRVYYDFVVRLGRVFIANSGCTDMTGCIEFFEHIDPLVRRIETYSDNKTDTVYVRNAVGQWEAIG